MIALLRFFTYTVELAIALPRRMGRFLFLSVAFNPRLGPLRHLVTAGLLYALFAVLLVYAVAPVRGYIGHRYMGD
ncbi:MAG: hypothetical protein AB7O57_13725, partial [Hyphomicrobiaceae bacterium]